MTVFCHCVLMVPCMKWLWFRCKRNTPTVSGIWHVQTAFHLQEVTDNIEGWEQMSSRKDRCWSWNRFNFHYKSWVNKIYLTYANRRPLASALRLQKESCQILPHMLFLHCDTRQEMLEVVHWHQPMGRPNGLQVVSSWMKMLWQRLEKKNAKFRMQLRENSPRRVWMASETLIEHQKVTWQMNCDSDTQIHGDICIAVRKRGIGNTWKGNLVPRAKWDVSDVGFCWARLHKCWGNERWVSLQPTNAYKSRSRFPRQVLWDRRTWMLNAERWVRTLKVERIRRLDAVNDKSATCTADFRA